MSNQLICYTCHTWRRVVAPVMNEAEKIVGWNCKKCLQKAYVYTDKPQEGMGWRFRFKNLLRDYNKSLQRENQVLVKPAHLQPIADVLNDSSTDSFAQSTAKVNEDRKVENKKGIVEHVKGLFGRGK